MAGPELVEHIARVKLETFCANVRAAYAEQCVVMPPWRLWQFLHMAWQPYGLWTKAVNGQWTDQYRQNHDEEDIRGRPRTPSAE